MNPLSPQAPGAGEGTAFERGLARALGPFAAVEPAEAIGAAALTLVAFLLLTGYYLLKTAREPLILLHGGAEVKSYAAAGQAVLLVGVVRAYSAIARRVQRTRLVAIVYLFFVSNLVVFAVLAGTRTPIGVPFYLWVGIFNYTAIAQFWAFAADTYRPEQGKRLFAILGIGSSVGAVAGARIAKSLAAAGPQVLMIGAAIILVVCVALIAWVDSRLGPARTERPIDVAGAPMETENPFVMLLNDRYLFLIAALTLLLNWVNSNGEYLLDRTLLASLDTAGARGMSPEAFVGAFKADYFAWVNLVGVLLQLFVVSRILTRFGVRVALAILPVVAFAGYSLLIVSPVLALVRIAKIAENSLDYSVENTARQALFLVATRVEKYVGKTLVDTLVVRLGDVLMAITVWIGVRVAAPTSAFATLNLALIVGWLAIVAAIGREHARRSGELASAVEVEAVAP